jgi:hypothetical protein
MKQILLFFAAVSLLASCSRDPYSAKLDKIYPVSLDRFYLSLDSARTSAADSILPELISRYPQWLPLYSTGIIKTGNVYAADFPQRLKTFFSYPEYIPAIAEINRLYPADSSLEKKLSEAFSYYKHYFSNASIPQIYAYIGGFNQSIVLAENIIGIGLDKYLGARSPFYAMLAIDQYKRDKMDPLHLVPDVIYAHIETEHPNSFAEKNLISEMLHQGRIMYALRHCFPSMTDAQLWGLSQEKYSWLLASERSIWEYLIDKRLLFDTDYLTIRRFTGEGPFTAAFSKESPARAAVWIGYRIIAGYAKRENASMDQIFAATDLQDILNKSKYRP